MYLMHNLPRLITDARPDVPVVREGRPIFVDGKPVKRNPEKFIATGLVVPVDGRELLLVPEGDRNREQYWVFQNPHQTRLPENNEPVYKRIEMEDKVLLFGAVFAVQVSKVWGSYVQARCMRIDVGPDAVPFPPIPAEFR